MSIFGEHLSEPSGATGFVSHEQLHRVQMEKFGHIETEHGIIAEKVTGEFQRQLRLSYASRPEKQERTKRFSRRLQPKLTAFQHGANAGNDVALAFDLGGKMRLKAGEFFDERIHDVVTG